MTANQKNRLSWVERRQRRPRVVRVMYAAYSSNDDELETHDQIRTQLRLKPEVGVVDRIYYDLGNGSPPRLKRPDAWAHTVEKEDEVAVASAENTPG